MPTTPVLWKGLTQVNTSDGGLLQQNAQVAPLQNGGYVVVWVDESHAHNPNGSAIVGQLYNALGEKVGGEVPLIGDGPAVPAFDPAVITLDNGNIAVAFATAEGVIFVQIFDPTLTLLRWDSISDADTREPELAPIEGGSYVVSYTKALSATDTDIMARLVNADGSIEDEVEINLDQENGGFSPGDDIKDKQDHVELATLSDGTVVGVYQDEVSGSSSDHSIRIVLGGALGSVEGAADAQDETRPDVAALTGGGFVVVWTDAGIDGSGTGIGATIYSNEGMVVNDGVGHAGIVVNSGTTDGNQNDATVVGLADGGFLVAWEDEQADEVRGQRLDASGNKIGSQFILATSVTLDSTEAPIRMVLLADGRVAFVANTFDGVDYDVVTSIWDPRGGPTAVAISPTITSLAEDASTAAPVKVADIAITDDGEGTNLLSLTGDDAAFFEIVGTELFLKAGTSLDFETKASYAVAVQVDDPAVGGAAIEATSATYTLNVSDVSPETVTGTAGSDTLTGSSDADNFVFNTKLNKKTNVDTIVGFDVAADTIHLDNDIFKKLKEGPLKKKYFEVGKKADDKDDFIVYNKKTGELFYDKNGDDKGGVVLFADLAEGLKLKADDFLVV